MDSQALSSVAFSLPLGHLLLTDMYIRSVTATYESTV